MYEFNERYYVMAEDTFLGGIYYTGITVDGFTVEGTLIALHRGTTSTMFTAVKELPEDVTLGTIAAPLEYDPNTKTVS